MSDRIREMAEKIISEAYCQPKQLKIGAIQELIESALRQVESETLGREKITMRQVRHGALEEAAKLADDYSVKVDATLVVPPLPITGSTSEPFSRHLRALKTEAAKEK